MRGEFLLMIVAAAQLAGCAVKTTPPKTTLEPATAQPLGRVDRLGPGLRPEVVEAVRRSRSRGARERGRRRQPRRPLRAGALRSGARRVRRRQAAPLSEGDGRRLCRCARAGRPGFRNEPVRTNTYRAGLDAFWEIDLFGRVRAAIAAASANAESFESALAKRARQRRRRHRVNYFELRGIQQRLSVLDRSLTNQRETLRLTEVRRDAGFGEEQDVASARARVVGDRGGVTAAARRACRT